MRLDLFLTSVLTDITRSQLQKQIKSGLFLINNKPASVHHFLKTDDVVSQTDQPTKTLKPASQATHKKAVTEDASVDVPHFDVICETSDWIVINKPAGVIVHPDRKTKTGTLVDALIAHAPQIAKIGEDPERPGIVHRLDREVSGLMIIAKTQAAYDDLKSQFAQHTVHKTYLALVHGVMSHDMGDIKFRIARSSTQPRMAARPQGETKGKAAWTHYRVLERLTHATLVELEIFSGRTHQIRAHLYALQHPVVGDSLYRLRRVTRDIPSPRLMLQSVSIAFMDPVTHEPQTFHLQPDPAFAPIIASLKHL